MRSFSEALARASAGGMIPVIPDIKMVSPKHGRLIADGDGTRCAEMMEAAGAPAMSAVTEAERFGGSARLLRDIVSSVSVPVLRKDFIKRPEDIDASLEMGASAVLLICAGSSRADIERMYARAVEIGIEPLVECRSAEELALAAQLGARLVGINNREITTLELDDGGVSRTVALARKKPAGATLISESGISSPADARAAIVSGADAVLVGTAIWTSDDPAGKISELMRA